MPLQSIKSLQYYSAYSSVVKVSIIDELLNTSALSTVKNPERNKRSLNSWYSISPKQFDKIANRKMTEET